MEAPSNQISILNANKGITNIVPNKAINTDLRRVTDYIFKTLSHHYGPYSGFAAKDDGQILKESTFTKDGIGIVRAINFVSPQEEWVRKTIAYIGSRMESSVGDGTTSAMMFTCAMLKHMAEHIKELKPCNYGVLRDAWEQYIKLVKDIISDKYTFSAFVDDGKGNLVPDPDKVYKIVYKQVYTSSHGDVGLSKVLGDMYRHIPQEQWERMTYERSRYETDTNYEVTKSDGQYQMDAEVMSTSMLNKDLCTWYESTNATVIIINDSLRVTHPDYQNIVRIIDDSSAIRPVVILCHTAMDTDTYQQITEKVDECSKEGRPVAIFHNKPTHPKVNDYVALQSLIGVDVTKYDNGDSVVREGCTVRYKGKRLSFDGLYEEPENWTGMERPHVTDTTRTQYGDILESWKNIATHYSKHAQNREDKEMANYYNRMYIKLRYTNVYTVVIGGKAYDNVAFVDVLDDAVRAASRALTNGVTLGNNRALYHASKEIKEILEESDKDKLYDLTDREDRGELRRRKLISWFAERTIESLEDLSKVVLGRLHNGRKFLPWVKKDFVKWWFGHAVDLLQYDSNVDGIVNKFMPWNHQYVDFQRCDVPFTIKQHFDYLSTSTLICQPKNSDLIMLERFGEVALKFILTEHVIIANGAYVNK
jgi:chaperonin GroEL (HSP60 family)